MIDKFNGLTATERKDFFKSYLPLLAKSIKVDYEPVFTDTLSKMMLRFTTSPGFGDSYNKTTWVDRESNWYRPDNDTISYSVCQKGFFPLADLSDEYERLPIFKCHAIRCAPKTKIKQKEIPMKSIKSTTDKMLDTNKEAVKIAAKLTVGKTSNRFILGKILGKFPWYTKLFSGKKKDVTENPFAKLVAAQTASAVVAHFASDNDKLKYISDAMVQDAMVDLSYNSVMLEGLLTELEGMINLPELTK